MFGIKVEQRNSLMANTVVWFDTPVKDIDRAVRFYSAVLNKPIKKEEYPGMTLAVLPHEKDEVSGCLVPGCGKPDDPQPSSQGTLLYFSCEGRLDQAVAAAEANGGKVLQARHAIGPYGFRAVVLDSEGNRIALHSM
jgi:predicted enzyme related to lactoylglutathione lyase